LFVTVCVSDGFPPTYIYKIAPGEPFFQFQFEDLDGKNWSIDDFRGKPIILLTGHRDARYDIREWANALKAAFADSGKIHLLWVVNPSRFRWDSLHKNVVDYWKKFDPPVSLVLDWHSLLGRSLRIVYPTPNIIGIDGLGRFSFHVQLVYSKANMEYLSAKIKTMKGFSD